MAIDAALFSGSKYYFFHGDQYIRITNGHFHAPNTLDYGYPTRISDGWGWGHFGAHGIDAALNTATKQDYFFAGNHYIRVTRPQDTGAGTVDSGYPKLIGPGWELHGGFGANGIDAALYSGSKYYFFKGNKYVRVTVTSPPGQVKPDPGYPKLISDGWNWPHGFGANGIDAALDTGTDKYYFFAGEYYIRVTRTEDTGPGTVDEGYPKLIADGWPIPHGF